MQDEWQLSADDYGSSRHHVLQNQIEVKATDEITPTIVQGAGAR